MHPRPVEGQREYALTFRTDEPATAKEAALAAAKEYESAGARPVGESADGLVLRYDGLDDTWWIAVKAEAGALSLRARPERLLPHTFWPPRALLAVTAGLVQSFPLKQGTRPATVEPRNVTAADAEDFLDGTLLSPARDVPVVIFTPGRYASASEVAEAARDLAGVAHIVAFADRAVSDALERRVGKFRGVFGGAVRIYRPGFSAEADPLDHDLLVAHYLDSKLAPGWSVAFEVARRLLPAAGAPIVLPPAKAASARSEAAVPRPAPAAPAWALEAEAFDKRMAKLEAGQAALADENRRLHQALRAAHERLKELEEREDATPPTPVPGLPWPLRNPHAFAIELAPRFAEDLRTIARDAGLAAELRKKMEAVLADPEDYGKDMRGPRHGQRGCRVARNYRLLWSVDGSAVRFLMAVSKEDPVYSPFGA